MGLPTTADRVLELLRISRKALDDDELARRLQVSPRQAINQACRKLERDGRLRRVDGPDGKLVNELVELVEPAPTDDDTDGVSIEPGEPFTLAPGSSHEQRQAESVMIEILGDQFGRTLRPRRLQIRSTRVEVDAADEELTVLVEAWAHQGPPKAAQKHKVLADALKLVWVARTLRTTPELILCLSDPEAARHFTTSRSWAAAALSDLGVSVRVVELPADVRRAVIEAQQRQFR